MRTIAIVNQKGGCGKTTTAINLSAELAHRSLRTLLVDMDPQGHCAAGLGVPEASIVRGIDDALIGDLRYEAGIDEMLWEVGSGLNLIPSTVRLATLEAVDGGIAEKHDRDRRLARLLEQFEDRFDFCIIDCPPTIGLLTFNALRAADESIVPVETGYFALRGAIRQVKTISTMSKKIGRPLDFFLLPTLHDESKPRSAGVLKSLHERFSECLCPVTIREHESLREAASIGQSIRDFAPDSEAAADFVALAEWLLGHEQTDIATEMARRHKESASAGDGPGDAQPRPDAKVALPDVLHEPKPTPAPSQTSTRVADVLHRVRSSEPSAGRHGFNLDLDRIPESRLESVKDPAAQGQSLEVEGEAGQEDPSSVEDAPSRYGPHQTAEGVVFRQPMAGAKSMAVTGDFNDWDPEGEPLACDPEQRCFQVTIALAPGRYEYQLLVDGEAGPDPFGHALSSNGDTPERSLLEVDAPSRS